ncbi:hypothetical protein MFLAVUS_004675 [Mucor flavus]|uniref:Uncharacterized protein n=1 Tax=Mucor flavus TaxID=439312 RepID=A0ABP9YWK7_9FUNG
MTKSLLLVQPLKFDDINMSFKEEEKEQEELASIDHVIDDSELLAILGFPSAAENGLLDWDDMPELSEGEEDDHKRKYADDDDDIFSQFDFEEVNLLYPTPTKKQKLDDTTTAIQLVDNATTATGVTSH